MIRPAASRSRASGGGSSWLPGPTCLLIGAWDGARQVNAQSRAPGDQMAAAGSLWGRGVFGGWIFRRNALVVGSETAGLTVCRGGGIVVGWGSGGLSRTLNHLHPKLGCSRCPSCVTVLFSDRIWWVSTRSLWSSRRGRRSVIQRRVSYEQLVITGNLPKQLSPVTSSFCLTISEGALSASR
jgi:hypothetical protein